VIDEYRYLLAGTLRDGHACLAGTVLRLSNTDGRRSGTRCWGSGWWVRERSHDTPAIPLPHRTNPIRWSDPPPSAFATGAILIVAFVAEASLIQRKYCWRRTEMYLIDMGIYFGSPVVVLRFWRTPWQIFHEKTGGKREAAMIPQLKRMKRLWCRLFHNSRMLPMHGVSRCSRCCTEWHVDW
jgi:hypothetical protein